MKFIRTCFTVITYALFAVLAYWAWKFVPGIDRKFMGAASAGIGALFTLIDGYFWKTLDGSHELVKSPVLTCRNAIELRKRLEARTHFLKRRWIFSFLAYLACIFSGIAIMAMPAKTSLPHWASGAVVALWASTIPALASLIWARIDSLALATDIILIQREHEDRENALSDLRTK